VSRPTHYYEPGLVYLITAVTYRRTPVFADPIFAQIAHTDVRFYATKFQLESLAHVVMPNHVHWLMRPSPEDFHRFTKEMRQSPSWSSCSREEAAHRYYLSKILQDYQRHVAYAVNQRRNTRGAKVWQDGFRDDALRDDRAVWAVYRYVVYNPVKAGLVNRPEDYVFWGGIWGAPG